MQLKWNQLAGTLVGQPMVVELTGQSHLEATVLSVGDAAMGVDVTSNKNSAYKKGKQQSREQMLRACGSLVCGSAAGSSEQRSVFLSGWVPAGHCGPASRSARGSYRSVARLVP